MNTLNTLYRQASRRRGRAELFADAAHRISGHVAWAGSVHMANTVRSLGVQPGAVVAFLSTCSARHAVSWFGVLQGGYVAWRHAFNPKLRGNLFVSAASYDNNPLISGLAVTKSARSIHANLIYTVLPKLEIGAEFIHGNREIESGLDGDLRRLHMHVKYSF